MPIDTKILNRELGSSPWQRFFFGQPVPAQAVRRDYGDEAYGFVVTGGETIGRILDYLFDRRNVMLVGPRGTGKSYMARKAVEQIDDDPRFGTVAVITLQGDPNKPPSDYFDDGIQFSIEGTGSTARVAPNSIKAPFFSGAERPAGEFKFDRDENNRLRLYKAVPRGPTSENPKKTEQRPVDRVVIFWDEGNRSSPAMQNAMLSLLADGVIRRDGIDYQFPPVSCVMTRNPDGYDAQSGKLPSPLVDRFGVQLYVYNPDLETLCEKVMPSWHADYLRDLKIEACAGLRRIHDKSSPTLTKLRVGLEAELVKERDWRKVRDNPEPQPVKQRGKPNDFRAAIRELELLKGVVDEDLRHHAEMALSRVALMPAVEAIRADALVISLVILSTWGDAKPIAEKPGMQYLSEEMRNVLKALGASDTYVYHAQRSLGQLTRYGTSIRAFVDLLDTLCGTAMRRAAYRGDKGTPDGRTFEPATTDLGVLREEVGRLLNHRCEPAFNPDREPDKAREKTGAMVLIARHIFDLAKNPRAIESLLNAAKELGNKP